MQPPASFYRFLLNWSTFPQPSRPTGPPALTSGFRFEIRSILFLPAANEAPEGGVRALCCRSRLQPCTLPKEAGALTAQLPCVLQVRPLRWRTAVLKFFAEGLNQHSEPDIYRLAHHDSLFRFCAGHRLCTQAIHEDQQGLLPGRTRSARVDLRPGFYLCQSRR